MVFLLLFVMMSLRIISLNCNGLNMHAKRVKLFSFLRSNSFDICFIQETHAPDSFTTDVWGNMWGGKSIWSFGSSHSRGVGILFNPKLAISVKSKSIDMDGRLICTDVEINNLAYRLITVYAPNVPYDRKVFFRNLYNLVSVNGDIILSGDFNCVDDAGMDKCGGNAALGELASAELACIRRDFKLIDSFRFLHPTAKLFTWSSPSKHISCRLDRIYVSLSISSRLLSADIESYAISDHSPVSIVFKCIDKRSGRNYVPSSLHWKCNSKVLVDEYFQDDFKRLWSQLDSVDNKSSDWWDLCKSNFRCLIIAHSQRISYARNLEINELKSEISSIRCVNFADPERKQHMLAALQDRLDCFLADKLEGAKIRSKANYLESHEKMSSYFLRTEKRNATRKEMCSLLTDNGLVTSQHAIIDTCKNFYAALYSNESIDDDSKLFFLQDHTLANLSEIDSQSLDGPITKDECVAAIKDMANNKSPGLDGLTKEFYAVMFPIFGDSFVTMINNCFVNHRLSLSQRTGLITLICKNSEHSADLENWRPISLLNLDYKILSKVLFLRLRTVIDSIVNTDQTCGVVGRSILDNLHLMRNVIDYVNSKNLNAAIISLDQSKAFDRVSHNYLFSVLQAFGFGDNFIAWIRLLYTDIYSSVLVNGQISDSFLVSRSVRQGCSLSPLLYILCMEPFAHKIRTEPNIIGLQLPGSKEQVRISQYADDTNIVVCNKYSIRKVFHLVDLFGLASGSKLNKEKTWGIWLGGWKNCRDKPFDINWTNSSRKLCGVFLGNNDVIYDNWNNRIKKVSDAINIHSERALSIRGKSVLIQSVICSKIWYIGCILSLPSGIARRIQSAIFKFVWSNKPEPVKRTLMYSDYNEGGMSIVNVSAKLDAFHIMHLYKLLKGHEAKWTYFAIYWLGYKLRKFVPAFASNSIPHSFYRPTFYCSAFSQFEKIVRLVPDIMTRNDITVKFFYNILLKGIVTQPLIITTYPLVVFNKEVWPNIHNVFVDANLRDLSWRVAHDIVPTNYLLYKRRIRRNFECSFCKSDCETVTHLFITCPVVRPLWVFVLDLARSITGVDLSLWSSTVILNVMKGEYPKPAVDVFLYLVNRMKHCIWMKRNICKFEGVTVTTHYIKSLFIKQLKLRLLTDKSRFKEHVYTQYWGDIQDTSEQLNV